MPKTLEAKTIKVLKAVASSTGVLASELFDQFSRSHGYKQFYNLIWRLVNQEYLERSVGKLRVKITPLGRQLLALSEPQADGVWKLVIFDIPEKHKRVRSYLRSQLRKLRFKKWQNSVWVTPYVLWPEVEEELKELSKKYFVRLIKSAEINRTDDLEKLFE